MWTWLSLAGMSLHFSFSSLSILFSSLSQCYLFLRLFLCFSFKLKLEINQPPFTLSGIHGSGRYDFLTSPSLLYIFIIFFCFSLSFHLPYVSPYVSSFFKINENLKHTTIYGMFSRFFSSHYYLCHFIFTIISFLSLFFIPLGVGVLSTHSPL